MSSSQTPMDFKQAIEYMDPMQVTDYLNKTLDFLKRNNDEICFPNISPYVEAFLVNLVTDTRNLKCKSFSDEDKKFALEIIEVLEMSKDVFRWTHTFDNGKLTKNLLMYKKIYSNKIMKKVKPSAIAHRLIQPQTSPQQIRTPLLPAPRPQKPAPLLSTGFKLHVLNKTLRFIKNEAETVLVYAEMASYQAEYINSLFQQHDNDVGFGYKSLYAPLWEAMEVHGVDYLFKMSLKETGKRTSVLKLKKIPRNNREAKSKDKKEKPTSTYNSGTDTYRNECINTSNKSFDKQNLEQSFDTSTCSATSTRSSKSASPRTAPVKCTGRAASDFALGNVSDLFVQDTVIALTEFTADESRASITFDQLTDDEMCFVRKVKGFAASKESRNTFAPHIQKLLVTLNSSIEAAVKTYKITTTVNEKDRGITLKKSPIFTAPVAAPSTFQTRSQSVASTKARDRSLSRDRLIEFQKASKIATDKETDTDKDIKVATDRGRSKDRNGLNKRTAKLLEDMSTPVESDRGIRMMLLMGWDGGALGARGEGIIEPIIPAIEMPSKAGLGHVPPPSRPAHFRVTLLHNAYDLLLHNDTRKVIQYKEPLTKKEKNFMSAAIKCLNKRRPVGLGDKEAELTDLVLRELRNNPRVELRAEVSQDGRTLTLIKTDNMPTPLKAIKSKVLKAEAKPPPPAIDNEYDVMITDSDIEFGIPFVDTMGEPMTIKTIKKRAARLVCLMKIADVLRGDLSVIRFKHEGTINKNLKTYLKSVIGSVNKCIRNCRVTGSEGEVYDDIQDSARGYVLSLEFTGQTRFTLKKTDAKVFNNNNNEKADNQNNIQCNDSSKDINVGGYNVDNHNLLEKERNDKSDVHTDKEIIASRKTIKKEDSIEITFLNDENRNCNIPIENSNLNTNTVPKENRNLITYGKLIKSVDAGIDIECDLIERKENKSDTLAEYEEIDVKNGETDLETKVSGCDNAVKSDLDKDIQDLEMAILKANLNGNGDASENNSNVLEASTLKAGLGCQNDLEMSICEELSFQIKKEIDTSPYNKRSRTNSICSQEIEAKRTKVGSDENKVIISLKNHEDKITEEIVKQVQNLISMELDKSGGFLPLINCYGIEKAGLVYGCHDNADVAWIKNIISAANLNLVVSAADDLCLDKKSRKLIIRINSFIPSDTKQTFKKLEIYNAGLKTKYWRFLSKHENSNFVLFIVEVDEKSLKYIAEENFSLYCGIDKAQFSIIF